MAALTSEMDIPGAGCEGCNEGVETFTTNQTIFLSSWWYVLEQILPATKLAFNFCTPPQTRAMESLWNHAGGKHGESGNISHAFIGPVMTRSGHGASEQALLLCA